MDSAILNKDKMTHDLIIFICLVKLYLKNESFFKNKLDIAMQIIKKY